MKNLLKLAGLAALLACASTAQAQNRYMPVTLVKNSGDTLRGYLNSLHDSRQVLFRGNKRHGREQRLSPADLQSFQLDKENYVSRTVRYRLGDRTLERRAFLQILASGQTALYRLTEGMGRVLFFVERNGKLTELENYKPDPLPGPDGKVKPTEYVYLTVLNDVLKPERPLTRETRFRQEDLVAAVYQSNLDEHTATARKYEAHNRKSIGVGVKYGENLSTVQVQEYQGTVSTMRGKVFGAFIDVPLEGLDRHLSLRCEALFSQKNTLVGYNDERRLNYIDFAAMLRYSSPKGLIRPYVGIGIVSGATGAKRSSFLAYKPKNGVAGPLAEVGLQTRNAFFGIRAESLMRDTRMFQQVFSASTGFMF